MYILVVLTLFGHVTVSFDDRDTCELVREQLVQVLKEGEGIGECTFDPRNV